MNVTVERIADSQVRLQITADPEEHNQAVDKAYRRISRDINVPGFRKGKAPRTMIERTYGREVFVEEANRDLMDNLYRQAIEQEKIIPVGDPAVESIEPEPLSFVVVIPVYPTIETGDYASVRVDPVDASISDSAVDELLEQLRLEKSPWIDPAEARKPKDGDQVTLDIQIMDGEEEFQPMNEDAVFVLGETNLLEELRSTIDTLSPGESTSSGILFSKDDDRYAEDDPRRGKTMTYNITLKGIKERDLLPLDDDFAITYGEAESLAELRELVYANLHNERTREARTEAVNAILEKINEQATLDIPGPMVDDAVKERVARLRSRLQYGGASLEAYLRQSNLTEEQLKADIRPAAARDLRTSLIMREIAQNEGIEITDSDIELEIEAITTQTPQANEMREAYFQNQYLRSALRNELFDQRLTDRLIEIATEGRGALINGFVAPEPAEVEAIDAAEDDAEDSEAAKSEADAEVQPAEASGTAETIESEDSRQPMANREPEQGKVPGDGSADCPEGYPVKGNADSMIYHAGGDSTYERTIPEFCFATTDDAVAAGYRPTVQHAKAEAES
ncbi:trigger factor [soil metagenome]